MSLLLLLFLLFGVSPAHAQAIPEEARLEGYFIRGDSTYFVFDPVLNDQTPTRVVVTGAFRQWATDMESRAWDLQLQPSGLWVLGVANEGYRVITPGSPFKYRINDGMWLNPPAGSPNVEGGNFVFLFGMETPRLRAFYTATGSVWAVVSGDGVSRSLVASDYTLTHHSGREIPISMVLPHDSRASVLVPSEPINHREVYFLEMPAQGLRTRLRHDQLWQSMLSPKPLGAVREGEGTAIRLFVPRATAVTVYLYDAPDAPSGPTGAREVYPMTADENMVWEVTIPRNLHGMYYDFKVEGPSGPNSFFFDHHNTYISDPYARVSMDSWGKGRIWFDAFQPSRVRGGRPPMQDVVAYEVHVEDFTNQLPIADSLRGTFEGMVVPGLRNERGEKVGFDFLVDLGINVVHLMPVQEFTHYPDSLWQSAFAGDTLAIQLGIDQRNYQWGYRTTHFFALESRYRTGGTEPGAEREQFRRLVEAFHERGIAVIIDIVPNHTGENLEGGQFFMNFNGIDPLYYYRSDDVPQNIGPYGNEIMYEYRPMTQRWLIDQARMFMEEFGIDGFRVDLAGQIDEQSLIAMRDALPPDAIIYGEPWIEISDPDTRANPDWEWYKEDAPITFFQDDARNAFKGPVSHPRDKRTDRGFAGGDTSQRDRVMLGLRNGFPEDKTPTSGINYLDIHDNWALADQFATRDWNGLLGVDEGPYKIAAALLMTSLGPVVLHGGVEILRSKGLLPNIRFQRRMGNLTVNFNGRGDSYNVRTPNEYVWSTVGQRPGENGSPSDFAGVHAYWRGLIQMRLGEIGSIFRLAEHPAEGYYQYITPENEALLGYVVADRMLVVMNVGDESDTISIPTLPEGNWQLIADIQQVNLDGVQGPHARLTGGRAHTIPLEPQTLMIWVKR